MQEGEKAYLYLYENEPEDNAVTQVIKKFDKLARLTITIDDNIHVILEHLAKERNISKSLLVDYILKLAFENFMELLPPVTSKKYSARYSEYKYRKKKVANKDNSLLNNIERKMKKEKRDAIQRKKQAGNK